MLLIIDKDAKNGGIVITAIRSLTFFGHLDLFLDLFLLITFAIKILRLLIMILNIIDKTHILQLWFNFSHVDHVE